MKLDPRGEQRKPHVILRTHSGVPTPPPWAKNFRPIAAGADDYQFSARSVDLIGSFRWDGGVEKIIAVEWLA